MSIRTFTAVALFALCISACTKTGPNLELSSYHHEFTTEKDTPYEGSVIVKNIGGEELIIERISTGCGCTGASVYKEKIGPRDTTLLTFTYDPTGKKGQQDEFVVLHANTDSLVHIIRLSTFVD